MITLTLFQVSTLITASVSLSLGLFVYFSGEKTRLNLSWLLTSIFISLWSIGLFGVVFVEDIRIAWFWQYVLDIGGICVPLMYFNFLLYLTKKEKKLIFLQITSLIAATALIILNFTDLFKTGISPKFGINFWIDGGKLYFLFPLYFSILVLLAIFLVIKEYRATTDRDQKRQLLYVLFAQIFGFGGGLTDFFPQLFNVYPFGNYFIVLYVIFISYAALRHHLFDIRVIATELLTFSIWVFLFIKALLSTSYNDFMLNGIILIAVMAAGILLIRSVLREVKQREQIEKMAADVKRAYEVEKKAHMELEKIDNLKNQFMMTIQHHLKTPLTSMMGYSDLLLNGTFGKQTKKTTEVIQRFQESTTGLIKMVNEFLDVTQFQLGKGVINLKPGVDIALLVEQVTNELKFPAEQKGLYLKLEKPNAIPLIKADAEKLRAALHNIFDNGIKYTVEGGLTIKMEVGNVLKIKSKDTGIGMSQERVQKLFNSTFDRGVEAKKNNATGRGIGLYLAGEIIKAHNGRVWAESEGEGKGSAFFIELPLN